MSEVPLYTQPLIEIIQDVVPVFSSLLDLPGLGFRIWGSGYGIEGLGLYLGTPHVTSPAPLAQQKRNTHDHTPHVTHRIHTARTPHVTFPAHLFESNSSDTRIAVSATACIPLPSEKRTIHKARSCLI